VSEPSGHFSLHPSIKPADFRTPLSLRVLSVAGIVAIGFAVVFLLGVAVALLFSGYPATGLFVAATGCFMGGLLGYVLRDFRGKWGTHVVLDADRMVLDLPGGRSLIHRPPSQRLTVPYRNVEAIETRLEAYGSLGMEMMQRAFVLRRKSGELTFLFEDRALGTWLGEGYDMFSRLAVDMAARAHVPIRDLGMVEGRGGFLSVWGTHAPDWSAPSLPLAQQLRIWRHVALTGTLSLTLFLLLIFIKSLQLTFGS